MFDAPPNLPVEPGTEPTPATPSSASAPFAAKPNPLTSATPAVSVPKPKPAGNKTEPEDIFADLDHTDETGDASVAYEEPERKSPLKLILIALAILMVVAGIGAAVWFFVIRPAPTTVVETPVPTANPVVVVADPEPVVERPVALPPEEQKLPQNIPPPQPVNTPPPRIEPTEAPDTDGDGLSDPEESVLSTNSVLTDTDGDSFADGAELKSGYDPAAPRLSLEASPRFRGVDINGSWRVFLPAAWSLNAVAGTRGAYTIQTGTPTIFRIESQQKPSETLFADWLATNEPTINPSTLTSLTTRAGYSAWQTADGLRTFIVTDMAVLSLRYDAATAAQYDYRALYEHIVQTIK